MKMLMIVCDPERQDEVRNLIARHDVHAYSELSNVIGEGETGKKLGTHAWPGKSVLLFTVVAEDKAGELIAALRDYHKKLYSGEGMKVFVLPVETVI